MVTTDRQFALAAVNHLWALPFGSGIGIRRCWDLNGGSANPFAGRLAGKFQSELLAKLADSCRQRLPPKPSGRSFWRNVSTRAATRAPEAGLRPIPRHEARRLSAEQMYDSMITATHTEQPMSTTFGLVQHQLPDLTGASTDFRGGLHDQLGGRLPLIDRIDADDTGAATR
jgi:hypothetical protein